MANEVVVDIFSLFFFNSKWRPICIFFIKVEYLHTLIVTSTFSHSISSFSIILVCVGACSFSVDVKKIENTTITWNRAHSSTLLSKIIVDQETNQNEKKGEREWKKPYNESSHLFLFWCHLIAFVVKNQPNTIVFSFFYYF